MRSRRSAAVLRGSMTCAIAGNLLTEQAESGQWPALDSNQRARARFKLFCEEGPQPQQASAAAAPWKLAAAIAGHRRSP